MSEDRKSEIPNDPEQAILHQDGFRRVFLGEVADPLYPPHPDAPESAEDELTRSALEDPAAQQLDLPHAIAPTLWRFITLLVVAVAALAAVFWWFR